MGKPAFILDGGLMGLGHPVGATGVRMLLDTSRGTTKCSFVVGRGA